MTNGSGEKSAATATVYHSLRLGKDLLFWSHVAKFSLELLINQHYLPALHTHADGYLIAAWQPFVGETRLQERFEHLVQMMPPVCRSYNLASLGDAPTSAQLVEHFVAITRTSRRPYSGFTRMDETPGAWRGWSHSSWH